MKKQPALLGTLPQAPYKYEKEVSQTNRKTYNDDENIVIFVRICKML